MPYRDAQICCNGHVISSSSKNVEKFCSECGSATISECPNCNTSIRGSEYFPGVIGIAPYTVPSYCYNCGSPYPWTKSKLEAIQELLDFDESLSPDKKDYINENINSLTSDTPKTKVVATKIKHYLSEMAISTGEAIKDILVDIISETAKKIIFG